MKMKIITLLSWTLVLGVLVGISSCKDKEGSKTETVENKEPITVFNFDDQRQLSAYTSLDLDASYPNLLNPEISVTDYKTVLKSWTELHQEIDAYLRRNNFSWGVEDESISILQKIYFEPDGDIDYYFFRVLNPRVSPEKKEQFADLLAEFAQSHQIDLKRDQIFAQCGKTKYPNG